MKKIFIFIGLFIFMEMACAQEVISSAGETKQIPGYEISWTIGEPIIETYSSGTNTLTQGFHQTKLIITAIDDIRAQIPELKVYPNPASEFIIIHFSAETGKKEFTLYDLEGKAIKQDSFSNSETRIDVRSLAGGTYLLKIIMSESIQNQTFKIVKK